MRMYNFRMMKKKIAIICQSDHHVKKSLVIQKEFSSETEIYYLKNKFFQKIEDSSTIKISSKFISSFHIFIFFTLQTNQNNIALYELIRKQKKIIAAFQESHQLGLHGGVINNLILQADIIFAASLYEKNGLISNFHYQQDQVKTYGWLFNNHISINKVDKGKNQNEALLILTAPESITASSYETVNSRSKLITTILELNPQKRLFIKPHPLEDINKLKSVIKILENKKQRIVLIQSEQSFNEAVFSSNEIYVSNRTQSCIDLIETRKLIIYVLGPDNFISSHARKFNKNFLKNSINFIEFFSNESIESFQTEYTNQDVRNFFNIENLILEYMSPQIVKPHHNLEIILWQYIHGLLNKKVLLNLLAANSWHNISNIIKHPDGVTQNKLDVMNTNLSIRVAVFLIYLREIIASDILIDEKALKVIKKNVTRWFAQYYSLDAAHLFFFLKNKHLEEKALEKSSLTLILNSIQILQKKSLILNLFIMLNHRVTLLKNAQIRLKIFQSLNLVWGILKR